MIKAFTSLFTIFGIFCVLYFSGELLEKGHYLNQLTPYPVLGYVLWGVAALFLYLTLIHPILSFIRLTRSEEMTKKALLQRMLRQLKQMRNTEEGKKSLNSAEVEEAYAQIDGVLKQFGADSDIEERSAVLLEKYGHLMQSSAKAKELIHSYSQAAGVAVLLSRNSLLDGLSVLLIQMKMVINLCRIYGYKPSPIFNMACFGWVLFHSVAAIVMQDLSEEAAESIAEDVIPELLEDDLLSQGMTEYFIRCVPGILAMVLESINAGAAVYITGRIFMSQLEKNQKRLTTKDLLSIRRKARKELGMHILETVVSKTKKTLTFGLAGS